MKRHNGGIVGKFNTTSTSSAKGRFSLSEIQEALLNGTWPLQPPIIDYLVVAGGGGGANGGTGGSGVVIIRIPTSKYTGTTTGSPTVTTDGAFTVLTYLSSGSYTT